MIELPLGQAVRLTAIFINAAGSAADPTTVTFTYGLSDQSPPPKPTASNHVYLTDVNVIKDSVGNYHYDFVPAAPGDYIWQAVGTGTVAAVCPLQYFRVLPSPFA
jgi:hypothetical protein